MLKKWVVFFVLLFLVKVSWGQSIEGFLIDTTSQEPLSFATIKLISSTDSTYQIADELGRFKFSGLKTGTYQLGLNYLGYGSKNIEVIFSSSNDVKLGYVGLEPNLSLLNEVTVYGVKSAAFGNIEKQVFDAGLYEIAKGGTGADILKNLPSVMVNAEGEISVRGSKGFLVLVNGKPSQIDPVTLLAQIPANSIEKIELLTTPSAKYDADGRAGIINVITKSGTTDGLSVMSNVTLGLPRIRTYYNDVAPQRYGIDGTLVYKKKDFETAVSLNYLRSDIAGFREGDALTTLNNVMTRFPSMGERSFKRDSYGLRVVSSFDFSKSDGISGGIYIGEKEQFRKANINYNNSKVNLLDDNLLSTFKYYNSNLVRKSGSFKVFNLDYVHRFDASSNLTLSGLYENAVIDGYTKNRNLNFDNYQDTIQYTLNNGRNPLNALRLKVDFEKAIGNGKFSAGYQYRYQIQKGSFSYAEKSGNFTPLVINPAFTANIQVRNLIHGLYTQYSGKYQKLEYVAGLRYENAFRDFVVNKEQEASVLKLSNLFPSVNLLYNLKGDLRLKLAYSRRVQRSTNNELNPFPEREHSETLEQGDPNIKPEFIGVYEAGILKNLKKGNLFWNVYSQQITDIVNRVNSVYNDTILNRIYTNAGNARLFGSEIGLTYAPVKKLKWYIGANVYQLKIKGDLFDIQGSVNSKGVVYSLNTNLTYEIRPTWTSSFNLSYVSARNTAQGEDSRFYQPNFSLKKSFKDFSVSVLWQNAAIGKMKVNQQRITTVGANFFTTTNYIQEVNIFKVNFSYNFNPSNKKVKLPDSEFGEREF